MSHNILNKYIWILDIVERYGRISRKELSRLWLNSVVSGNEPLTRRTFYNYRNNIEDIFGIKIAYDNTTFEYYIEQDSDSGGMSEWLVNSISINGILSDASDVSNRIMLEEIPSARKYLSTIIEAIKTNHKIEFSYTPFYRTGTTRNIVLEPYFLRIFKQRWYVIGYNHADKKIKTYSLDRFNEVAMLPEGFEMPETNVRDFFTNNFGIMTSNGEVKDVTLRVEQEEAKYIRALPLHHSQTEKICDGYSLFHYKIYLTFDFVNEIISHGNRITVISPVELKTMVVDTLQNALENYK